MESFQTFKKKYEEELAKDVHERTLPVFQFDLLAGGFNEIKFAEGVKRSFISTGCVPLDDSDVSQPIFQPYSKHNLCGTMKVIPTGTSSTSSHNSVDFSDIALDETNGEIPAINFILEYDSAMLEYDHEITEAINL